MISRATVATPQRQSRGEAAILSRLTKLLADAHELTRSLDRVDYTVLLPLLDKSPCAALLADKMGVFVFTNAAASQLTGYTTSELRGMSFLTLTPHVREGEADLLWRAFVERGEQSGTYQVLAKGGRIVDAVYAAKTNVVTGFHLSLLQRAPNRPPKTRAG
jgi:PAS domain S-box-containing protein